MIRVFITLLLFTVFLFCMFGLLRHQMSPFRAFLLALILTVGVTFSMAKLREGLGFRTVFGNDKGNYDFLQVDGGVMPMQNGLFMHDVFFKEFKLKGPVDGHLGPYDL